MVSERLNAQPSKDDEKNLSRRQFLRGMAAAGAVGAAAALTGLPEVEAANGPKEVPSVEEIAKMVQSTQRSEQLVGPLVGSANPLADIDAAHKTIEGIMSTKQGARSLPSNQRLEILMKSDTLKLGTGKAAHADLLLYLSQAKLASFKSDAELRKVVEEKVRPAAVQLSQARKDIMQLRDDVVRRFP
ncbi:twin-arginine translocation signal domain-containing protein [Candidatus Kaiserbacteria bacterium]|nr:twin-arginine translocation signal domain-containing protein [Candidatus Kaiserbacteria bacterium]